MNHIYVWVNSSRKNWEALVPGRQGNICLSNIVAIRKDLVFRNDTCTHVNRKSLRYFCGAFKYDFHSACSCFSDTALGTKTKVRRATDRYVSPGQPIKQYLDGKSNDYFLNIEPFARGMAVCFRHVE